MSRTLTLLVLALTLTGCATGGGSAPSTSDGSYPVTVRVENNRWFDMRVFVEGGTGVQQPLGIVAGQSRAAFVLPRHLVDSGAELRLVADPSGSTQRSISDPLDLAGTRNVEWILRRGGGDKLHKM